MIRNFPYLIVFTSAPGVLPEQHDPYRIQPRKVNEIKAYKNQLTSALQAETDLEPKLLWNHRSGVVSVAASHSPFFILCI